MLFAERCQLLRLKRERETLRGKSEMLLNAADPSL